MSDDTTDYRYRPSDLWRAVRLGPIFGLRPATNRTNNVNDNTLRRRHGVHTVGS